MDTNKPKQRRTKMQDLSTEIAKVIGQPIDSSLPIPFPLNLIADQDTAEAGEDVYVWTAYDDNVDTVYTAGSNGALVSVQKSSVGATLLTFVGIQTKLDYVTIHDVINAKDQSALARKKAAISRAMDKEEIIRIVTAIQALATQEVIVGSGVDIYDAVMALKHKIEDYGDGFVLLVGSTLSEKMDTYDKDNASNFQYNVTLLKQLEAMGITKVKLPADCKIKLDGGSYVPVLAAGSAIMVATQSNLKGGKPILHVRRKFNAEMTAYMGLSPEENATRLVSVAQTPIPVNGGNNILGYGVFGYEGIIEAIVNYKAISWANSIV